MAPMRNWQISGRLAHYSISGFETLTLQPLTRRNLVERPPFCFYPHMGIL
jgi:hypothetical protein